MGVVVTGAAGHVGGNLVRALLARHVRPRVLVHRDARALAGLDVERFPGDLRAPRSLEGLFQTGDLVFHLAACISLDQRDAETMRGINLEGTRHVVEACRRAGVRRLVHFSSVHAFASAPHDRPVDETRPAAEDDGGTPAYDVSKAEAERLVTTAAGLEAVILNPTGIIGPHDYRPSAMGQVLLDLGRSRLPGLVDGGFNWVDVRDVVEAALAAAERGRPGERYLVGGRWCSVRDVAAHVAALTGRRPPKLVAPMWLARAAAPAAVAFARLSGRRPLFTPASLHALRNHRDIRCDKAARELGHRPRPLDETIADTIAWFRAAGVL